MRSVLLIACLLASPALAQDGASYNPDAKKYRAPQPSLESSPDTPERMAALAPLWQGDVEHGLPKMKALAEQGDAPAALLLAGFYRSKSNLPIQPDPASAIHYIMLASVAKCGEASERIAEMVEKHEVTAEAVGGDAAYWRKKAREQGWKEQQTKVAVYDWIHGSEPLQCQILAASEPCPSDAQMSILRLQGITGVLRFHGGWNTFDRGPEAKVTLIMDHNAPTEQDLLEPDGGSTMYLQTPGNTWRMFPENAPLLDRYLVLKPNEGGHGRMLLEVQAVNGSGSGGSVGFNSPR